MGGIGTSGGRSYWSGRSKWEGEVNTAYDGLGLGHDADTEAVQTSRAEGLRLDSGGGTGKCA